eukprot:6121476-Amphidinium_carterae.1
MLQHPYYDAMQSMLDGVETGMTEYLQTKQYLKSLVYHRTTTHLQMNRENKSTSSKKPFTTTAESCSTS